jgi:uncharacterized protein
MSAPFVWFDRAVADGEGTRVSEFYQNLFGWTIGPGVGDYQGFVTDGGQPWAGLIPSGAASAGRWVPYVVVEDLDAAAKQAVALGATVVKDKTVGPAGTSVTVADPGGALVALFAPDAG